MTDDTIKDDEPSIEEILSSIRDIISDDDEEESNESEDKVEETIEEKVDADLESTAPTAEKTPSKEEDDDDDEDEEEDEDEDVLDLTDVAEEQEDTVPEDNEIDIDAMFKNEDKADDPLAGIDLAHPSDDDLEITDNNDAATVSAEKDDDMSDILSSFGENEIDMSEQESTPSLDTDALLNNAASTATVSSLARLAENIAVSRTASGTTLEDIVRELLRPMLKEWLDGNLPDVIERLVAKELERLAEKAARK